MAKDGSAPVPEMTDCARKRLAHTPMVAIDVCTCGMMQLHVGALTLRMAPEALRELTTALELALRRYAVEARTDAALLEAASRAPRGQA